MIIYLLNFITNDFYQISLYVRSPLQAKTKFTIFGHKGPLIPYKAIVEVAPPAQNFCFIMNYNCAKFHACITMCMIKLRICPAKLQELLTVDCNAAPGQIIYNSIRYFMLVSQPSTLPTTDKGTAVQWEELQCPCHLCSCVSISGWQMTETW